MTWTASRRSAGVAVVGAVVPCKDEAPHIERCLTALRRQGPRLARIVVVDNGSTDGSLEIARRLADEVIEVGSGTISVLRNAGAARLPDVDVLALVDADTEVADDWLEQGLAALVDADLVGSRSEAGRDARWVARRWAALEAASAGPSSLLWTQHLLVTREAFDAVGGFAEDVLIGEDGLLTVHVRASGRRAVLVPALRAQHHGFPDDLRAFVRRERWHTHTAGWFGRSSTSSRATILAGSAWAGAGLVSAVLSLARRDPRRTLAWSVATLAGGAALGLRSSRTPVAVLQDGLLLSIWLAVRVARLPGELWRSRS